MPRNLFLVALLLAAVGCAAAQQPAPHLEALVARMEQAQLANRAGYRAFVVTRDYKLYKEAGEKLASQVTADVTFQPPDQKEFAIRSTTGSSRGEKVVRKVLEKEAEVARQVHAVEITRRNYRFRYLRDEVIDGAPVHVLALEPLREEKGLIKGEVFVDRATARIRRIIGEPARKPSWLVKELEVTLFFGEIAGMWLQTGTRAWADVRFAGKYLFTGRDVSYRTAVVAQAQPPRLKKPRRKPQAGVGSAIALPR